MEILVLLFFLAVFPANLYSAYGNVLLKNGNEIEGNVVTHKDGSIEVSTGYAIIRFERREIRTVRSKKPSSAQSASSLRNSAAAAAENKNTPILSTKRSRLDSKSEKYDDIICSAAYKHGLDPQLIKAVMRAESCFNEEDISSKGACGLMQLMPETAKLLGVKNIFSPKENVNAGTKFLKAMLYEFDGDLELALAAYNAGPAKVRKYKNVPPYRETRNYIKTVYKNYTNNYRPNRIYTYSDDKGCLNIYNVR